MIYVELGALLVALFMLYVLIRFLENPIHIILNSVMGIIVFIVLNFVGVGIPISILSIAVVAIGGLVGVLLVVILHFLGLGF